MKVVPDNWKKLPIIDRLFELFVTFILFLGTKCIGYLILVREVAFFTKNTNRPRLAEVGGPFDEHCGGPKRAERHDQVRKVELRLQV